MVTSADAFTRIAEKPASKICALTTAMAAESAMRTDAAVWKDGLDPHAASRSVLDSMIAPGTAGASSMKVRNLTS